MKRYGFKFEPLGSSHTQYEYLRFAIAIFTIFGVILSKLFSGEWFGNVYLLCWLTLTIISLVSEIYKPLSIYPVMLTSILVLNGVYIYGEKIFLSTFYVRNYRLELIEQTNTQAIAVFVLFNVAIIFVCCIYVFKKSSIKS